MGKYIAKTSFGEVNTLSPFNKYYYKIKDFGSLNASLSGCRIALFDIDDNLLYHNKNAKCQQFPSINLELVKWSKDGNFCVFPEYTSTTLDFVYLNLPMKIFYRLINWDNFYFIQVVQNALYDGKDLEKRVIALGIHAQPNIIDKWLDFNSFFR